VVFRATQRTVGVLQPLGVAPGEREDAQADADAEAQDGAPLPAELGATYAAEIELAMGLKAQGPRE